MNSSPSTNTTLLTMESLDLSQENILPVFIFVALTYFAILFFNLILMVTIALNQKLYKPMYMLMLNMPVFDIMGSSALFPQLMFSILTENRSITYSACAVQAFMVHMYATGSLLILTVMAYDRYVAICFPLKYNTLMSPNKLIIMIIVVWTVSAFIVGLLLGLNYREKTCSTKIVDTFCNNPSLMKLICGDISLNNYLGLSLTILVQAVSLFVVFFTYIQILITCVIKKHSEAKSKALQTCGTHLVVLLIFEFNGIFTITAHRFNSVSPHLRRAIGVSVMVFPPFLNPLIYGLKTKEISQSIFVFYRKKISPK